MRKVAGAFKIEVVRARSIKHGNSVNRKSSRTYNAWKHAKERCYNPNIERYANYGGRGIGMYEKWRNDFSAFLRDMGECPSGLTIERIDIHRGYEPGNCRWATHHEQARNRTDNVFVEHEGRLMILKDYAALTGLSYKKLSSDIRKFRNSA